MAGEQGQGGGRSGGTGRGQSKAPGAARSQGRPSGADRGRGGAAGQGRSGSGAADRGRSGAAGRGGAGGRGGAAGRGGTGGRGGLARGARVRAGPAVPEARPGALARLASPVAVRRGRAARARLVHGPRRPARRAIAARARAARARAARTAAPRQAPPGGQVLRVVQGRHGGHLLPGGICSSGFISLAGWRARDVPRRYLAGQPGRVAGPIHGRNRAPVRLRCAV